MKDLRRPKLDLVLFILLTVALQLNTGCEKSPTLIEGSYIFRSDNLVETLELKAGGEFSQRIVMGDDKYETTGRWSLKSNELELGSFLVRFDNMLEKIQKPPRKYSYYNGYWDRRKNRIFFDVGNEGKYFVSRMK